MGVRFGEREWRDRIQQLLDAKRERIQAILAAYGVPQLDDEGRLIKVPLINRRRRVPVRRPWARRRCRSGSLRR
jgi:hypothetical protein